jgi:predicted amidohydrolase YtcJ
VAASTLITGGTVVDGTGAPARRDEAVLLRGGRIAALGAGAVADAAAHGVDERVDATGGR